MNLLQALSGLSNADGGANGGTDNGGKNAATQEKSQRGGADASSSPSPVSETRLNDSGATPRANILEETLLRHEAISNRLHSKKQ